VPKRTHQVAALPWRQGEDGLEILLVTTRTSKRWVIPKGWTMEDKADHEAAAIEAYEEAGAVGDAEAVSASNYRYRKILRNGKSRVVRVEVFTLQVNTMLDDWPERLERERQWLSPQQALQLIGEPGLVPVIVKFGGLKLGLLQRVKLWLRNIFLSQQSDEK
jgi:8-oxo-dGTP pyrophosphatase MutT (NUDIX family)